MTNKDTEPQRDCPRWQSCSINHCPLDPEQDHRLSKPTDPDPGPCPLAKAIRSRIAEHYPDILPRGGLTPAEFAGKKKWESLPEEVKRAKLEQLACSGFKTKRV